MTPDTAALRRDHYDYDSDGHCDDCGERYPCVVRALCDAADEVERLRDEVNTTEATYLRLAQIAAAERDAARTAHAALVADLRALCDEAERAASGRSGVLAAYAAQARKTRALLDRHAPTTGATS